MTPCHERALFVPELRSVTRRGADTAVAGAGASPWCSSAGLGAPRWGGSRTHAGERQRGAAPACRWWSGHGGVGRGPGRRRGRDGAALLRRAREGEAPGERGDGPRLGGAPPLEAARRRWSQLGRRWRPHGREAELEGRWRLGGDFLVGCRRWRGWTGGGDKARGAGRKRRFGWLTNRPHYKGKMVISSACLTALEAKLDGMVWRRKKFDDGTKVRSNFLVTRRM